MLSAVFSFLGGTAFRAIWGELSTWINARQEHQHEIERMKVQGDLDAAQHARNLEAIRLQADIGVEVIHVQADADVSRLETDAWSSAVKTAMQPTGAKLVDGWNGIIRPLAATIAILLWVAELHAHGFKLSPWDQELVSVILGFFFASRALGKK